ncbi:hypothetical protein BKI52_17250 [marine bacterium AO1-C]|nr:hypothetical protein BKI52_17250 [marine bacterium AO1-C]
MSISTRLLREQQKSSKNQFFKNTQALSTERKELGRQPISLPARYKSRQITPKEKPRQLTSPFHYPETLQRKREVSYLENLQSYHPGKETKSALADTFTIYYNDKGEKIGEDEFGGNNGRHLIVKDPEELNIIIKNTQQGRPTKRALVNSKNNILLPEANTIYEMGLAVQRTKSANDKLPDGHPFKGDDDEGGFHEEGGRVWLGKNGEVVVPAKPGKKANKKKKAFASLDISDEAKGYEKLWWGKTLLYTFHTHTAKKLGNDIPLPPPSAADLKSIKKSGLVKYGFVLAIKGEPGDLRPGRGTVYIYNSEGIQATFPIDKFLALGKKKN